MSETPAIGIDLGTTNSVVAIAEAGDSELPSNAGGVRVTPSAVAYDGTATTVGHKAANQSVQHPERTIYPIKRDLDSNEKITLGDEGNRSEFTPEELTSLILKQLKNDAEAYLGQSIESAVITVPAYFSHRERQATRDACDIAGLEVDRLLNEPTAACLAYDLGTEEEQTVLVYDLGGSFDVSLIEIDSGVFEVIAINGDMDLGGREWDAEIVDWLYEQIEREHGVTVRDSPATTKRLFDVARETKHDLSSDQKAQIDLSFFEVGTGTVDIEQTLSRTTFKQLTHTLTEDTIDICEELFAGGQYGPQTVDEVILVGGTTRIAQVQDRVTDYFGLKPSQRDNPNEVVALGAATQAAVIN